MKIHGLIYIIIGAFVVGFSYYITSLNNSLDIQKFILFIWVGGFFFVIGLFKIFLSIKSRPKKPKVAKENYSHHQARALHNREHAHGANAQQGQTNEFVKFCSSCGGAVRHFDNFCYKCGSRMFHKK